MVLLRFSDRGLVSQGKPSLLLFHQLYWILFGAFFSIGIFNFIIQPIVLNFENTHHAQICMLQPIKTDESNLKSLLLFVFVTLLPVIYGQLTNYRVKKYVSGICPRGRMSAIGKYRRNLITFEENNNNIIYWGGFTCCVVVRRVMWTVLPDTSPTVVFWSCHTIILLFVWLYLGLILPLTMETPCKSQTPTTAPSFYVTKPVWQFSRLPAPPPNPTSTPDLSQHMLTEENSTIPTPRRSIKSSSAEDCMRTPSPIPSLKQSHQNSQNSQRELNVSTQKEDNELSPTICSTNDSLKTENTNQGRQTYPGFRFNTDKVYQRRKSIKRKQSRQSYPEFKYKTEKVYQRQKPCQRSNKISHGVRSARPGHLSETLISTLSTNQPFHSRSNKCHEKSQIPASPPTQAELLAPSSLPVPAKAMSLSALPPPSPSASRRFWSRYSHQ